MISHIINEVMVLIGTHGNNDSNHGNISSHGNDNDYKAIAFVLMIVNRVMNTR